MNILKIKNQFPIFGHHPHLVYLDNGATSQKPRTVLDSLRSFYEQSYANIHRGLYTLSEQATDRYEQAREKTARFIHARAPEEVIFTRGTTEGINLVAQSFGEQWVKKGDEIVVSLLEHHANFIPWQRLAQKTGAVFTALPITDQGLIIDEAIETTITPKTRFVAITHTSNVLGVIPPLEKIIKRAHKVGAKVLVDAAQSVAHIPTDVQKLDCDFLVFSGHKMYGPTGIGVLWGRKELLDMMPPFLVGGGMIKEVTIEKTTWAETPEKFEGGTPPIAEAVALEAAIEFIESIGFDELNRHESEVLNYAFKKFEEIPCVTVFGPKTTAHCHGCISFLLNGVHAHDVAALIDEKNVAVRVGHHCAQPLMKRLGVPATTRMSLGIYNSKTDIDALVEGLLYARRIFGYKDTF